MLRGKSDNPSCVLHLLRFITDLCFADCRRLQDRESCSTEAVPRCRRRVTMAASTYVLNVAYSFTFRSCNKETERDCEKDREPDRRGDMAMATAPRPPCNNVCGRRATAHSVPSSPPSIGMPRPNTSGRAAASTVSYATWETSCWRPSPRASGECMRCRWWQCCLTPSTVCSRR